MVKGWNSGVFGIVELINRGSQSSRFWWDSGDDSGRILQQRILPESTPTLTTPSQNAILSRFYRDSKADLMQLLHSLR